jgi:hypothetical protein
MKRLTETEIREILYRILVMTREERWDVARVAATLAQVLAEDFEIILTEEGTKNYPAWK